MLREVAVFKKILAAVELTEPEIAAHVARAAGALANKFDSDLRFVNVQSLVPIASIDYAPENFDEGIRLGLEKELAAVAAKCGRPLERVSSTVTFGPVHQHILAEAESWGADMIIVGSHRPSLDRILTASNATALVRDATCAVLVVR